MTIMADVKMDDQIDYEALKKLDIETIPFSKRIEAFYEGTRALTDLSKQIMIPQLTALIQPSRKEEIIKGLYYRIYAWMYSLVSLKEIINFQAAASVTRSIFELLLDIKLMIEDKPKNSIAKFDAFIEVEKFRIAKKYVDFKVKNPDLKYVGGSGKENLVNKKGEEARINNLIVTCWGKDKKGRPMKVVHWTGWKTDKRAQEAGKNYELFYHEQYALLSLYTHAGLIGIQGMKKDGLEAVFGNAHMLATPMFSDATLLVAKELKLMQAIPQLVDWIQEAKSEVGKILLDEHIKQLQELKSKKEISQ